MTTPNTYVEYIRLDVGCGENKNEGCIGMDVYPYEGVDVVHDANVTPWPFDESSISLVIMSHSLEYLDPTKSIEIFDEIWRILKPGGACMVATHYANSFQANRDPLIRKPGFNEDTPFFFDPTRRSDGGEYLYDSRRKPWQVAQVDYRLGAYLNFIMKPMKHADGTLMPYKVPAEGEAIGCGR